MKRIGLGRNHEWREWTLNIDWAVPEWSWMAGYADWFEIVVKAAMKLRAGLGLEIEFGDAGGETGEDFPGDGFGFACKFGGGNGFGALGTDEDGFFARAGRMGEVANIDTNLVHGDAAEDGAALTGDQDVRVLAGEMSRVSIAVSYGKGGGSGGFLGDVGTAV